MDETATEHLVTYTDPQTALQVRCACVVFADHPAIEWVVAFVNGGPGDTPLLEDVQALDVELSGEDWVLHRALGSSASRSDFAPVEEPVPLQDRIRLAPVGGRSSNTTALPFFNIAAQGEGVMAGIGWSGLYAFWDALLARHPGLIIDNCASGGRRIDLETVSRSIPLWRTDYRYFEPNGYQCHTYGLSFSIPFSQQPCESLCPTAASARHRRRSPPPPPGAGARGSGTRGPASRCW